jgi:hypothetical protein
MEYNLLKTIEKPLTYFRPNEAALQSSFPSQDFVNPGVGNIIKSFSVFVPLHTHDYLHLSQKSNEADQLGFGSPLSSSDGPAQAVASSQIPVKYAASPSTLVDTVSDIPEEIRSTNERKRKLVGEDIFEQFMHPKIKTSKFKIENQGAPRVLPKKSSTEHKFKLH